MTQTCIRAFSVIFNWESDKKYEEYVLDCFDRFGRKITEIIHIKDKQHYCQICLEIDGKQIIEYIYNLNHVVYESYEV